jgi:peptidoglycan hydrolase-like protein with peptidoglycan-binding domain
MPFTLNQDTLMHLRDNLDGLGYAMGPRGLFGLGNDSGVFDATAVGNSNSALPLRKSTAVDAYTRAAVFQFQRDRTLPANGEIGEDLYNRVDAMVKDLQNNLKIVLLSESGVDKSLLAEFDNSTSVPADQKFRISGYYGNQTFRGIKEYQRLRRLPITGIATIAVARQLADEARRLTNPNPKPPVPTPETDAVTRITQLSQIKQRYQRGEILSDDFVRQVIQNIP